ncbi:terminase [Xenorhabdus sp. KK7.4]|nr:terminase [Xenorhabdus sp. KK7.4]
MARPTKYQEAYAEQARKLCLLGYTDKELADFFEVSESTLNNWKHDHPGFLESLKKGKQVADGEVAAKLFHRATGYEHAEDDKEYVFPLSLSEMVFLNPFAFIFS